MQLVLPMLLELVYEDPQLQILRVGDSFRPRLFRADEVHAVAPGVERAAAWIRARPKALARGAVVVEAPSALHEALQASAPAAHRLELTYPSHAQVHIRVASRAPGLAAGAALSALALVALAGGACFAQARGRAPPASEV